MAASLAQTEALKMVADWCKWVVTIETGAIAVMGALATNDPIKLHLVRGVRTTAEASVGNFVLSILLAVLLLSAVPTALEDIQPGDRIWDRGVYALVFYVGRLYFYAHAIAGFFLIRRDCLRCGGHSST